MKKNNNDFLEAGKAKESGIISEFIDFINQNKKFWLIPILLVFLILGGLLILGGTSAAPFIYTLF